MKKIFISICAVAALAACTKSEIQYDEPAEIGFAPATKNITKAAMPKGTLPTTETLGIWAFWNGTNGSAPETAATYANYTDAYLANASFKYKTGVNWGGDGTVYPWPTNGALVFAGYTQPKYTQTNFSVGYYLNDYTTTTDVVDPDVMVFNNYTQSLNTSETYDLCWFGRTTSSYNNRADGTAVPVTLSHALTWITVQVKGKTTTSVPVTAEWRIKSVVLNSIKNVGTGVCIGTTTESTTSGVTTVTPANATWTFATDATASPMTIYNKTVVADRQKITASAAEVEDTQKGTVIIPQEPTTLTVVWEYPVGSEWKEGTATIDLKLNGHKDENGATITNTINKWEAGKHYTYTLVFDSNEILVAPSYSDWASEDRTVTVE